MDPERLKPLAVAEIGSWKWTIPNWDDFEFDNPPGHVETSPQKTFVVMGQEFRFCYDLTLPNGWDMNVRLINQSNKDVQIKHRGHSAEIYTLKPGEGSHRSTFFYVRHDGAAVIQNEATIVIDTDMEAQLDFLTPLENHKDSDFKFICQGKEFPCHRVFLRAKSPVLDSAFDASEKSGEYKLDKFNPDSVKKMLQFVYSSSFQGDATEDLLRLADFLDIEGLVNQCCKKLAMTLSNDNVFDRLNFAETLDSSAQLLKEESLQYIADNYDELKDDPVWETMTNRRLRDILDRK